MHGLVKSKPEQSENKEGQEAKFPFRGQGVKMTALALFRMVETCQHLRRSAPKVPSGGEDVRLARPLRRKIVELLRLGYGHCQKSPKKARSHLNLYPLQEAAP
jgi:hypothetical protein